MTRNRFGLPGMVFVLLWMVIPSQTFPSTLPQQFLTGIQDYKSGSYSKAIDAFLKITETGIRNGKLYYNLGNAYLKNNDLGHALLWYERALNLTPNDPDLKFNYQYALSQTKDERENRSNPVFKVLFFWKYLMNISTVKWTAIIFNALFWMILILNFTFKKNRLKIPAYFFMALAFVFTATACYNFYNKAFTIQAIILPEKVSIRSGLNDEATELFTLHAGSKITIEKQLNDHFRIYFSEGKIGWIKQSEVGII